MPVLTLERDLKGNHPVVNKFSSNHFTTRRSSWCFSKPGSTHLGVNILTDFLNIVRREFMVNLLSYFSSHFDSETRECSSSNVKSPAVTNSWPRSSNISTPGTTIVSIL